ncbi:MAG TPA: hypothetical protein VEC18_00745 [Myxococcota bacterium]|nr:hypothetical protein [Myxococcota bacterium]
MTRRLAAGAAGALLGVALAVACGKYGPPVRTRAASAPRADAAGEGAQGTAAGATGVSGAAAAAGAQSGPTSVPEPTPAGSNERDSEPEEAPR